MKTSQNSQENTYSRVSFSINMQGSGLQLYLKKDWHRRFPKNFAKVFRTAFLQNTAGRLLLTLHLGDLYLLKGVKKIYFNPFQPFHIETSRLICTTKHMTGFYMKCNTRIKWVNTQQTTKPSTFRYEK